MPTTYPEQFWLLDPFAPPPAGTLLTVQIYDMIDNNNNNLINRFSNDRIDGSDIRQSYPGDTVTVTLAGGGTATITGTTFYLADGRIVFTPTDGSYLTDATLVSTTFVTTQGSTPTPAFGPPPCFVPGTQISTTRGPELVENLQPGDLIVTADRGPVPLSLIHERVLSKEHLLENPKHHPVKILADCMGRGMPCQDLIVSPQHRILIRSYIAEKMFGTDEILVPAAHLVGWPGITRLDVDEARYIHLLFDHHAIVLANGVPTESLFLGDQIHEGLSSRDVALLKSKFSSGQLPEMTPARLFVRGPRLRKLLERHLRNNRPLLKYGLAEFAESEARKRA